MNILISRTDKIGDVVLTLPLAGFLKQQFPDCQILFLGRTYTRSVVALSKHIDHFLNWDDIRNMEKEEQLNHLRSFRIDWFLHVFPEKEIAIMAKKANIPKRVGTSHRSYHWLTCNRRVHFSRKRSDLHESQLNFKLLQPFGIQKIPSLAEMVNYYGFSLPEENAIPLPLEPSQDRVNIILHPKSKGIAREWGLENFGRLIDLLQEDKYRVYVSGTKEEGELMREWLDKQQGRVEDVTGRFTLEEFIHFIGRCDALVAASTGPLHIAAALGKRAIGIYPPIRPMHPGRWRPLGDRAGVLVKGKDCSDCRKTMDCHCMKEISAEQVKGVLSLPN
jgi:heptosyltransferase-3